MSQDFRELPVEAKAELVQGTTLNTGTSIWVWAGEVSGWIRKADSMNATEGLADLTTNKKRATHPHRVDAPS
jgi:hypothetical protein